MRGSHFPGAFGIWVVGVAAYFVAVFHRSSLAVAGLVATERFDISASQLASFTMLQLLVYALMQVPVGLFVDRFGPRRVMLVGSIILALAQLGFAFSTSYPLALVARTFVGVGDAMTFVCLVRLINTWFAPARIPLLTQISGPIGQFGAILSAIPMTWALGQFGWTAAYAIAAMLSIVISVAIVVVVHDEPGVRSAQGNSLSWLNIRQTLRLSWEHPGTRLAFWIHFATPFSTNLLGLLWGFPFLIRSEQTTEEVAGLLLSIMVIAIMVSGPMIGWFIGKYPWHRSTLVILTIYAMMAAWVLVLAWPGPAPLWALLLLVIVSAVGGPASMVGFDLARTSNPVERLASATGIVNQGGFISSLLIVVVVGVVLDWRTPGNSAQYTEESFIWAMSFQFVIWFVGLVQIFRYRRKARRRFQKDDPDFMPEKSSSWSLIRPRRNQI